MSSYGHAVVVGLGHWACTTSPTAHCATYDTAFFRLTSIDASFSVCRSNLFWTRVLPCVNSRQFATKSLDLVSHQWLYTVAFRVLAAFVYLLIHLQNSIFGVRSLCLFIFAVSVIRPRVADMYKAILCLCAVSILQRTLGNYSLFYELWVSCILQFTKLLCRTIS